MEILLIPSIWTPKLSHKDIAHHTAPSWDATPIIFIKELNWNSIMLIIISYKETQFPEHWMNPTRDIIDWWDVYIKYLPFSARLAFSTELRYVLSSSKEPEAQMINQLKIVTHMSLLQININIILLLHSNTIDIHQKKRAMPF